MPHAEIRNRTEFAFEATVLTDEEARPQYVAIVQAVFSFAGGNELVLLEEQPPPNLAGEWYGDPATASIKLEPQIAFVKPATDVVLLGHALAPHVGATEVQVGIMVGPVRKIARVVGDRRLIARLGVSAISSPEPFEKIPLIYERAFGGWDRTHENPEKHACEMRNPVGVGFRHGAWSAEDELIVPNIEYPDQLFKSYGDKPTPAGFGFIAANWQPRLGFAGSYGAAWNKQRKPLLPANFDRRFFNSASPGLIAPGYLVGNEPVAMLGVTAEGRTGFQLPGIVPPTCIVELRGRQRRQLSTNLDTIIVDADLRTMTLQWRGYAPLRNLHDVISVEVLREAPATMVA